MCYTCGDKYGSKHHQLYWFSFFIEKRDFKKAFTSIYHLFSKKAYRKWFNKHYENKVNYLKFLDATNHINDDAPEDYGEWLANIEPLDYMNMELEYEKRY